MPALKKMNMSESERMSKWEEPRFPLLSGAAVESTVSQTKSCGFLQHRHAAGVIGFALLIAAPLLSFLLNCEHSPECQLSLCF